MPHPVLPGWLRLQPAGRNRLLRQPAFHLGEWRLMLRSEQYDCVREPLGRLRVDPPAQEDMVLRLPQRVRQACFGFLYQAQRCSFPQQLYTQQRFRRRQLRFFRLFLQQRVKLAELRIDDHRQDQVILHGFQRLQAVAGDADDDAFILGNPVQIPSRRPSSLIASTISRSVALSPQPLESFTTL